MFAHARPSRPNAIWTIGLESAAKRWARQSRPHRNEYSRATARRRNLRDDARPRVPCEPFDFVLSLTESSILAVYGARRIVGGELTALEAARVTNGSLEELGRLLEGAEQALDDPGCSWTLTSASTRRSRTRAITRSLSLFRPASVGCQWRRGSAAPSRGTFASTRSIIIEVSSRHPMTGTRIAPVLACLLRHLAV